MKKLGLIVLFIAMSTVSLFAYQTFEQKHDYANGICSDGSAWVANADSGGYWASSGPKGNGPITKSLDIAIRTVCGE